MTSADRVTLSLSIRAWHLPGRHTFWVNVPVRIHQDFKRSLADIEDNRLGGGDLAKYLVLPGYSIRF